MDNLTQELIEKYKSEMQKMISNAKSQNERNQPQTPPMQAPRPPQPPAEIQPRSTAQDFPRFEADSEGLKIRIEEILRQNSDVATSDDYPSPRGESYSTEESQMQQTPRAVQIPQPTQPQNLPSDAAFETPPPPMQFQSSNTDQSQNEITFESQATAPSREPSPPMTEEEIQANETPQQTVSRVCIRGGAKAQYSPPANTGSSRLPPESENPALSEIGRLRVETFAANRAYPISNAVIRIKNPDDNSLVAVLVTNQDGLTESVDLPAPSETLSQTPEFPDPFFNYNVDIHAEGYMPRENLNAQMFGGVDSLISANLVPQETSVRSDVNA
ncbi:MAG: hypothetical protein IJ027_08270 [Oscillospiraceae bacterium]|nr:hypothetical protein [Oscillospiraceae bacterium]